MRVTSSNIVGAENPLDLVGSEARRTRAGDNSRGLRRLSEQRNECESGMRPCPVLVLSGLCDLEDVVLHGNDQLA